MIQSARRTPREHWIILALLAVFLVAGLAWWWNADAEDLASSFVGCRLLAAGHPEALFNYDTDNFAGIGPGDIWQRVSAQGGFTGFIHPYVQTPLWGWGLEPLCTHVQFPAFSRVFLLSVMLCFAATVWLIARFWTPSLFHPLAIALILAGLWFSQPFQYAMFLMQTHALFLFLTVASLILAERDRPGLAGLLLACAAAVKVTPGVLLIYWLLTRRWKAALSVVVWSAVLMFATVGAVGSHLVAAYFADLHRISRVLLVSMNNQSFAAWLMGRFHPEDDFFDVDIFPLPTALRLASMGLLIAFTAAGGWIDRRRRAGARLGADANATARPPVGAMMAMVAATVFAPIAWTHYSVILVAPVMVLLEEARRLRSRLFSRVLAGVVAVIVVLNFRPVATDVIRMDYGKLALLRGQFYAGVLCLAAVALSAWVRSRERVPAEALTTTSPARSGVNAGVHCAYPARAFWPALFAASRDVAQPGRAHPWGG